MTTKVLAASASIRDGRWQRAVLALIVLASALTIAGLVVSQPSARADISVNQCNGVEGGPLGATTEITCTVTVVNTINGGITSSTTTLTRLCANQPCPPGNGTFTSNSTELVTSINQCNGSANDAAAPLRCTVSVSNNISPDTPGAQPVTNATVNQCNGSGAGGGALPLNCDPEDASTSGATVTQCNGSGNGGGGTGRVVCTVPDSEVSPAIPVRVNQCNDSANAGGNTVTCETSIATNITAAATATPTATATATASPTASTTPSPSSSATPSPTDGPTGTATPTSATPTSGTPTSGTPTSGTPTDASGGTGTATSTPTGGPRATTGAGGDSPAPTDSSSAAAGAGAGAGGSAGTNDAEGQVTRVPPGGVQAGGGSTAGLDQDGLLALGGGLLLAAAVSALVVRSRVARSAG